MKYLTYLTVIHTNDEEMSFTGSQVSNIIFDGVTLHRHSKTESFGEDSVTIIQEYYSATRFKMSLPRIQDYVDHFKSAYPIHKVRLTYSDESSELYEVPLPINYDDEPYSPFQELILFDDNGTNEHNILSLIIELPADTSDQEIDVLPDEPIVTEVSVHKASTMSNLIQQMSSEVDPSTNEKTK